MRFNDQTRIGGGDGSFQTTRWTMIGQIGSESDSKAAPLINDLMKLYWRPVYCCLRQKGYDNEASKDLTQGFFQEVVLGRKLIQRADHDKGRFRTLLLTALDRYLRSEYRKKKAQKRIPDSKLIQIDLMEAGVIPDQVCGDNDEESFNYAWLSGLLDNVLSEVEDKCSRDGSELYWKVFCERVLNPVIDDTEPVSIGELCDKYGIETPVKASNMILTVKRRFESALKRQLRQSVVCDEDVNTELKALLKLSER